MRRVVFKVAVVLMVVWIVATVISPSYDLPNTVVRAGKFAPPVLFDFLLTPTLLLLCCTLIKAQPFATILPEGPRCASLLTLTCVLLC
jgi:hypothetical protein